MVEKQIQYKLATYEIETLVEYIDDYIKICIEEVTNGSTEVAMTKINAREALVNYLREAFGYGEG